MYRQDALFIITTLPCVAPPYTVQCNSCCFNALWRIVNQLCTLSPNCKIIKKFALEPCMCRCLETVVATPL